MYCKRCNKEGTHFHQHFDGGYVCDDCIGSYFTCPSCGMLFDNDDLEHANFSDGKCISCAEKNE